MEKLRPFFQPELETLDRAELARLQVSRLVEQAARAAQSPFYRHLWQSEPVIRTVTDIRRLPFLHRQALVEAQLAEPPLGDLPAAPREEWREVYPVAATGGSAYTVYAEADLTRSAAIGARILWACGLRPGDLIHNGFSYGLFAGGINVHRAARAMGAGVIPIGTDAVKRQVEFLFNFRPAMLVGAPSHTLYLAERIRERGLSPRDVGIKAGLFGAEPGAAEAGSRSHLERIFGCPAYDLYGITEVSTLLAGECPAQQGLHWAEDHVMVEVINPRTLEPCYPGEQGVLVLTDLTRRSMPLLRYWTGDMASVTTEPCPCGRTHARSLGGIRGRSDEMILFHGAKFYPSQVGRILAGFAELGEEYRIILERDHRSWVERCRVEAEAAPGATSAAMGQVDRIQQRLMDDLRAEVGVAILPYGSLDRTPRMSRYVEDRRVSS